MQSCQVAAVWHGVITPTLPSLTWCEDAFIFISQDSFFIYCDSQLNSHLCCTSSLLSLCHKPSLSCFFLPADKKTHRHRSHPAVTQTMCSNTEEEKKKLWGDELMILVVLTRHWLFAVVCGWMWIVDDWCCVIAFLCHLSRGEKEYFFLRFAFISETSDSWLLLNSWGVIF